MWACVCALYSVERERESKAGRDEGSRGSKSVKRRRKEKIPFRLTLSRADVVEKLSEQKEGRREGRMQRKGKRRTEGKEGTVARWEGRENEGGKVWRRRKTRKEECVGIIYVTHPSAKEQMFTSFHTCTTCSPIQRTHTVSSCLNTIKLKRVQNGLLMTFFPLFDRWCLSFMASLFWRNLLTLMQVRVVRYLRKKIIRDLKSGHLAFVSLCR